MPSTESNVGLELQIFKLDILIGITNYLKNLPLPPSVLQPPSLLGSNSN